MRNQKREVELDGLSLQVPTADPYETVFVTLFRTAVERASCGLDKSFIRTGEVPHLLNIAVLAVADGLFGLYGSERRDELFTGTRPPTPHPVPGCCGRKAT